MVSTLLLMLSSSVAAPPPPPPPSNITCSSSRFFTEGIGAAVTCCTTPPLAGSAPAARLGQAANSLTYPTRAHGYALPAPKPAAGQAGCFAVDTGRFLTPAPAYLSVSGDGKVFSQNAQAIRCAAHERYQQQRLLKEFTSGILI